MRTSHSQPWWDLFVLFYFLRNQLCVYSWLSEFMKAAKSNSAIRWFAFRGLLIYPNCTEALSWRRRRGKGGLKTKLSCGANGRVVHSSTRIYTHTHKSPNLVKTQLIARARFTFWTFPPPPSRVWRLLAKLAKFPPSHMLNPSSRPISSVTQAQKDEEKKHTHPVSACEFPESAGF